MWIPHSQPQWLALLTQADELFYGGAAGGGKTDLVIGLAIEAHQKSLILRREARQLRGIIDRSLEIIGERGRFNENQGIWRGLPGGRQIELGGCKDEKDKRRYQGRPHDLLAFDEAPEFLKSQVDFIIGWARTDDPDQRVRIIFTGNPPTSPEGRWIVERFAPWLDSEYHDPALPGELRYFAVVGGEEKWLDGPEPFEHGDETITPKSRTFIPARVDDNPVYMATGYKEQLMTLPEPLRSQLLYGDFGAGVEDDKWQVIPTAWIRLAFARWQEREQPETPLSSLGCDPARGGADKTVLSRRYDNWFAPLEKHAGSSTPDGPAVVALVIMAVAGELEATINVDVIGIGSSVFDLLATGELDLTVSGVNFAAGSDARDKSGRLKMRNIRAEAYWSLREALDPDSGDDLALPRDNELLADLTAPKWKLTAAGVLIESKEDIVKRLGRSPDCGDAIVLAHYGSKDWLIW